MRKQLCRNFQQGSCRYGENCKFLHPQQVKLNNNNNNPFGFGNQQQQVKPSNNNNNPFGFGPQSTNQQQQQQQQQQKSSNNPFGFGVQQSSASNGPNQFQAFDNKWTRTPSGSGGGGGSTQQSGKQTQQGDHKCTDPAACKRVMQDDFKNERPMWKFTCYSHWKYLPCDISGDMSYEELRFSAYEQAKQGIPLHSIVGRERNMQEAKMAEFNLFLQQPYKGSLTVNQSPFPATTPSVFPPSGQLNSFPATTPSIFQPSAQVNQPSAFPPFGQPAAFTNTTPGGPSLPGAPNAFASFNQTPNAFSANTPQPGPAGFPTNTSTLFKPASFGTGPGLATIPQNNNIFPSVTPTPAPNAFQNNQNAFNFNAPVPSFTTPVIATTNTSTITEPQTEGAPVDTSIWLKEKWNPGEIPEQAPPDAFV